MTEPSDHCYVILQDHGPDNGGWGPAAFELLGSPQVIQGPAVYTGSEAHAIRMLKQLAQTLAEKTGKTTRLARYTQREDVHIVDDGLGT